MATTSMSLGPYWENFLKELVESGRFATQSEAVREALRALEFRERKQVELQAYLRERIAEADRGDLVAYSGTDEIISEADIDSDA